MEDLIQIIAMVLLIAYLQKYHAPALYRELAERAQVGVKAKELDAQLEKLRRFND